MSKLTNHEVDASPDKGNWRCNERRDARNYSCIHERSAFNAGYSDAWFGYSKNTSCEPHWYPNAYSAGYWEGYADKQAEITGKPC